MWSTLTGAVKHLWNHGSNASTQSHWVEEFGDVTQFKLKTLKGGDLDFAEYKGKVLLFINVASECGYTKGGYTELVRIQEELKDKPFQIVAFPCNQFGGQESKSPEEIENKVCTRFKVNFPLTEKIEVNGENTTPVYAWLKKAFPGDISWNFAAKFIIDQEGRPVARFEKESYADIQKYVEALLAGEVSFQAAPAKTEEKK